MTSSSPGNGCTTGQQRDHHHDLSDHLERRGDRSATVKVTFTSPQLPGSLPFVGSLQRAASIRSTCLRPVPGCLRRRSVLNPVGTGPYMVDSFSVNDQVIYKMNPNYREANKPFFETVNIKAGGEDSRPRGRAADGRLGLCLESSGRAGHPASLSRATARAPSSAQVRSAMSSAC